jgi:trimethylamine--corrinoid protein Co-methyltransferase
VRWRAQLAAYAAPPLDAALDEALCDYITRAKHALPDEFA